MHLNLNAMTFDASTSGCCRATWLQPLSFATPLCLLPLYRSIVRAPSSVTTLSTLSYKIFLCPPLWTSPQILGAISDHTVRSWDAWTGHPRHVPLRVHTSTVHVLESHPWIPGVAMSAGYDGLTVIWDIGVDSSVNFSVNSSGKDTAAQPHADKTGLRRRGYLWGDTEARILKR